MSVPEVALPARYGRDMGVAKNGLALDFYIAAFDDFGLLMVLKQLPIAKNSVHINAHSTLACY